MKKPKDSESYFLVDEAGDYTFYNRAGRCVVGRFGCSPILILGFVEVQDPRPLRRAILDLHAEVTANPFLNKLPSARKTAIAFHTNSDAPEVRFLFCDLLRKMEFKAQLIVMRKIEQVFRQRYGSKERKLYDDLVTKLFERVLHRFKHNEIIFAQRGSRARKKPLGKAIWRAKGRFENRCHFRRDDTSFKVYSQRPNSEPCLSVVDYVNWAVYRAFVAEDTRYYEVLKSKISLLVIRDMPELPHVCTRKKPFDARIAAPQGLGLQGTQAHGM